VATTAKIVSGELSADASGTTDFTSSGFGSPDAAIIFSCAANSGANPRDDLGLGIAFWDGTNTYGTDQWRDDNVTPTAGAYRHSRSGYVSASEAADANPTLYTVSSITDGIRLTNSTDNTVIARRCTVLLLKGLVNKAARTDAYSSNSIHVTTLGFAADVLFVLQVGSGNADTNSAGVNLSFGIVHKNSSGDLTQKCVAFSDSSGSTSAVNSSIWDTVAGRNYINDGSGSNRTHTASDLDADGYTFTLSGTTLAHRIFVLALELDDPDNFYVGVKDSATSTGATAYTGFGIEPIAAGILSVLGTGVDSTSTTPEGALSIGLTDGVDETAIVVWTEDNLSTSNAGSRYDGSNVLNLRYDDDTVEAVAALDSFDSDGLTLNYSDASSAARKLLVFAFGDGAAGGGAVTVNTGVGALAITGHAPTIQTTGDTAVSVGAGALTVTGLVPTATTQQSAAVDAGSLTITGHAPTISTTADTAISVGAGALTITCAAPTVTTQEAVAAGAGALTLTGHAPTIQVVSPGAVAVPSAALTLTGHAPTVTTQIVVSPDVAALAITGHAPSLSVVSDTTVQTGVGALAIAGHAPTVSILLNVLPGVGQIIIEGHAPTVTGGTPSVVATRQEAGGIGKARKPSTRRRKPILINVDGEEFVVSSEAEAVDLIEKAREVAEANARAQSATILEKRKLKAARDGKLNTTPLRLDEPSITVTPAQDGYIDKAWVAAVDAQINEAISKAYESAARDAETQLLLAQRIMVDEEDALVALLLTL
jgi:hypothetical protein